LVPLIELLLLLLFLLRVALLHRRRGANQWMRFWRGSHLLLRSLPHLLLLRLPEVAIARLGTAILLRLHVSVLGLLNFAILRLLNSPIFWLLRSPILGLPSSLLLVSAWLRLRHLPNLGVAAVRLVEWPETVLRRRRSAALIHLGRLCGSDRTNQYLLVQMSTGLRLPLIDGVRRRRRSPHGDHRTADHR
jgi:hypothetical protein